MNIWTEKSVRAFLHHNCFVLLFWKGKVAKVFPLKLLLEWPIRGQLNFNDFRQMQKKKLFFSFINYLNIRFHLRILVFFNSIPYFSVWKWKQFKVAISYSVFQGYSKAKSANGGSILSSSQFLKLPQLPQKIKLASKVVKVDSKIIILLPKI